MSRIPTLMHQLYFPSASSAPARYLRYRERALAMHPQWEHRFWTEATARGFLSDRYPSFLPLYDAYPYRIQRCDAIRYFLLHAFGGVYADMDVEFLRPLDDLLDDRELVFCNRAFIGNAVMGSVPEHPLWPEVFDALRARRNRPPFTVRGALDWSQVYYVSRSTGSELLEDCVVSGGHAARDTVSVLPGHVLEADPHHHLDAQMSPLPGFEDVHAVHHKGMRGVPLHLRAFSRVCCSVSRSAQTLRSRLPRLSGT